MESEQFPWFLAQKAKQVYGVEIVPAAIEDAKKNAALNKIENAEFYVGKAEEVLPGKIRKGRSVCRCYRGRSTKKRM